MAKKRDTQVIELIGRNWLVSQLLEAKLEVAIPLRDEGIDLIVYTDKKRFDACPIQMKASTEESFSLDKKYKKFPNMILVYVWHLKNPSKTTCYALTFSEAKYIMKKWGRPAKSLSWKKKGGYSTSSPSEKLIKLLKEHEMSSREDWSKKVKSVAGRSR